MPNPTRTLAMGYRGISLATLRKEAGPAYTSTVENAGKDLGAKYPNIVEGEIQGTKPHPSKKDKTDDKDVITVGYYTKKGTRYLSIHAHSDGTWKEFFSRAGRSACGPESKESAQSNENSQSEEQS